MILLPALLLAALGTVPQADPAPLELTLDDCMRLALSNNLSMAVSRLDAEASIQSFNAAWGAFDTSYFINASISRGTRAPSSSNSLAGGTNVGNNPATTTDQTAIDTGFRGAFLTGTTWSFDVGPTLTDVQAPGQATLADPNPPPFKSKSVIGRWTLSVTQPLLRNGADDYPTSALELARHDATIAALASEDLANTTLQSVTTAYWNLVSTRQNVKTAELSVQLATELLDITKRKFDQGLQNKINVTQTDAELASRRVDLITARNNAQAAEDALRTLVLAPQDKDQWGRPIVAKTQPSPPQDTTIDLDAAIATALQYRADVASARESLQRADVAVRQAENQTRPQLDLTGSYGLNTNQPTYGTALNDLDDTSFNETRLALVFAVPIGNRTAGYALRQQQVERERSGVSLRQVEMNAVAAVRTAVRDVQAQAERVAAANETVRLQNETYEGEKRRLENDLSTPFQVRQAQRDLLTALDAQTAAQLDLENARAALLAAQGRLLYAYGVERSLPELSLDDAPPAP